MNGSRTASTKYSSNASSRIDGANGRKRSRNLIRVLMIVAHVRASRVGDDASIPERARPPLHAALKPPDDLRVGDPTARSSGTALRATASRTRYSRRADLFGVRALAGTASIVEFRAPERVIHHERSRCAASLMAHVQGGAKSGSVVAGGGLDVHLFERRVR